MADCIFCKIANGEIKTDFIYEDETVVAFRDLNPQAPVHTLIIPKKHIKNIEDLHFGEGEKCHHGESEGHDGPCDGKYIKEIFKGIKEVAKIKGVSETGYRIISNCGKDAGQTVMHLHFHLIAGKELGDNII